MPEGYRLEVTVGARDDLRHIDRVYAEHIVKKMRWVAANATQVTHEALKGDWEGFYRWRIGNYRAIYQLEHDRKLLVVAVIGHRREIYDE
jgi:mRNA interferase RelE/StbE